ncbi:MAG: hypothetical protein IJ617_04875, partial [Oscillospiraceae bacterium]|nr:hypothetical protein [Oscillospiraceae bacterium]
MSTIANEFDLDAILNEFRGSGSPGPQAKAPADRSKRLVLKSVDDAIQEDNLEILNGSLGEAPPQAAPEPPRTEAEPEAPEPEFGEPVSVPPPPETSAEELTDDWEDMDYASAQAAGEAPPETARRGGKQKSKSERILAPLVGLLALIALRREQRARGAPAAAAPEGNEPDPKKALDLYTSQEVSLRLRALAATVLTLLMLYVSCAWSSFLPLGGVLGSSVRVASALLLLMELSVMLCGLDLFTGGLMGFAFGEIGTESLAAASCVLSVLDAMILAGTNNGAYGLPYCAVSAASMTGLLWGAYFNCRAGRGVCRVLSSGKSAYSVCSDTALSPGEITLFKLRRNATGFIARSEEADLGESVYAALSPFLLIASVLLGLLSSLARGRAGSVVHCISVMSAVSATFSCAVCVALPLYIASRKLTRAGSALAVWSGLHDVGAARSIVITDEDLFPYGTVRIGSIRVVQNADADKVISYTG